MEPNFPVQNFLFKKMDRIFEKNDRTICKIVTNKKIFNQFWMKSELIETNAFFFFNLTEKEKTKKKNRNCKPMGLRLKNRLEHFLYLRGTRTGIELIHLVGQKKF